MVSPGVAFLSHLLGQFDSVLQGWHDAEVDGQGGQLGGLVDALGNDL